ncbi:hypothetical protein NQ314_012205 [Rhamnusium bicolor]|uniref:Uncharacterized protein n=1 Tax=Rhamnusium bicolor TaxID=1586634 RepID=A0AAV8XDF1_9CUCU|nr:hypothetical protein NQ314_012205 [Rhamnusium bicolor]
MSIKNIWAKMSEQQLIRKSGSLKSSPTSFSKFVELKKVEKALGDTDVIQLQDRLSRIENVYEQFNEIQNEIEAVIDETKLDEQFTERLNFEESFFKITAMAKSILTKYEPKHDDNASVHSNMSAMSITNSMGVKLPVISLPKFQGSYEGWLEYRETFESLVHYNEALNPIQRYHYLRASLEGSAALVIKSVEFTAAGYAVAWQALCDRYNNTKLLVRNYIKAIFSLDIIQKESSAKIRKLLDDLSI